MRRALLALMLASCTFPGVTYDDASVPLDAGADAPFADGGEAGPVEAGDDAGDAGDPCDLDHDGYRSMKCDGGNDCNDNDPRVHPGLTQFVYDVPDAAPWGDWNCDGTTQEQYTPPVSCTAGLACNTSSGFVATDPGCGKTAPFVTCANLCAIADAGTRTQGCL